MYLWLVCPEDSQRMPAGTGVWEKGVYADRGRLKEEIYVKHWRLLNKGDCNT